MVQLAATEHWSCGTVLVPIAPFG
jgi:ABC-type uncharacterized transport system substrate-binding protein